jgi:hypothetical protein
MIRQAGPLSLVIALLFFQSSCVPLGLPGLPTDRPEPAVSAEGCGSPANFPFKEAWYGTYFSDEKVGYSHFKIEPSGRNFKISTDSLMRLTAMRKTNEIRMKERVIVRPDLTLVSFDSVVRMNGKDLRMKGRVEGNLLNVDMTADGERLERQYGVKGDLYHLSAISLMPALKGLADGRTYSFTVFNPQKQRLEKIRQRLSRVRGGAGPEGAVWRVKNHLRGTVKSFWMDRKGLTVLERGFGGSLITLLEDKETARKIREKAGNPKDLALDFSLVRVSRPIPNSEKVRTLKVRMSGVDRSLIPSDHRQRVAPARGGSSKDGFDVTVISEDVASLKKRSRTLPPAAAEQSLGSDMTIRSGHEEIVEQARKIVSAADSDLTKVKKLVDWTAKNIRNTLKPSSTALSVLRSREGECRAHTNLYAAMARSLKIPTRLVTGLVYTREVGFLYHAWAESWVNGWLAVDPSLGQVPADATHIKISAGDSSDWVDSLIKMAGKVKIEIEDFR